MHIVEVCVVLALSLAASWADGDFLIISKPLVVDAELGQKVTLPCEYKARPDGIYRLWFHDQNVISVNEKIIYRRDDFALDGSNLIVSVSKPALADKYICKFNDPKWSNVTHRIRLLGPPVIEVDPKEIDVREGGTITINCMSSSAPLPTIVYSKVGSTEDLKQFVNNQGILQIRDVTRKHAGVYTCAASNGHKPDGVQNITVRYEGRPDVSVAIQWNNLNSDTEKTVEISCRVASETATKVIWRKGNQKEIENNANYNINTKDGISTLKISSISQALFDNYTCTASNSHGDGSDSVEISSLPIKPIPNVTPKDVSASLSFTTVSPYRVLKFVVTLTDKAGKTQKLEFPLSENDIGDADGKYSLVKDVNQLVPNSDYEGTVYAVNDKDGSSAPAKFAFHTQSTMQGSSASLSSFSSLALIAVAIAVFVRE